MDRGDHDHWNFRIILAEPFQQLDPVHLRHDHVAQNEIGGGALHDVLRRAAIAHCRAVIALRLEHRRDDFANGFFVIHNQNVFEGIRLHVTSLRPPVYERSQPV